MHREEPNGGEAGGSRGVAVGLLGGGNSGAAPAVVLGSLGGQRLVGHLAKGELCAAPRGRKSRCGCKAATEVTTGSRRLLTGLAGRGEVAGASAVASPQATCGRDSWHLGGGRCRAADRELVGSASAGASGRNGRCSHRCGDGSRGSRSGGGHVSSLGVGGGVADDVGQGARNLGYCCKWQSRAASHPRRGRSRGQRGATLPAPAGAAAGEAARTPKAMLGGTSTGPRAGIPLLKASLGRTQSRPGERNNEHLLPTRDTL